MYKIGNTNYITKNIIINRPWKFVGRVSCDRNEMTMSYSEVRAQLEVSYLLESTLNGRHSKSKMSTGIPRVVQELGISTMAAM